MPQIEQPDYTSQDNQEPHPTNHDALLTQPRSYPSLTDIAKMSDRSNEKEFTTRESGSRRQEEDRSTSQQSLLPSSAAGIGNIFRLDCLDQETPLSCCLEGRQSRSAGEDSVLRVLDILQEAERIVEDTMERVIFADSNNNNGSPTTPQSRRDEHNSRKRRANNQ